MTEETIEVVVTGRETAARDVLVMHLSAGDGRDLPSWEPGAHVDLLLPGGLVRQYSLSGDPGDRTRYRLGILREPRGRGGSAAVHAGVSVGDRLAIRGPRNHFPLIAAPAYVFVAGGIGVTPILPMVARARAAGAATTVLYGGRTRESMAFAEELFALAPQARICPEDETGLLDLPSVFDEPRADTAIYCCGPEPLLAAVERATAHWPAGALHVERFAAATPAQAQPGGGFSVELRRSGLKLPVASGQSILEVVAAAGVDVLSSCEDGVCGTCLTPVLGGEPDHRDSILSASERASGTTMAVCVSRASPGSVLVLDL